MTRSMADTLTGEAVGIEQERNQRLFRTGAAFNLLLAIENDDVAPAAIRLTSALVSRGAIPSVVRAAEIMAPAPGSDDAMVLYAHAILGEDFNVAQERSLRELIEESLGHATQWPVKSIDGHPSDCILGQAELQKASLIVMGIHAHGVFSQTIGENTATSVMAKAQVPVVGVRLALTGIPRRIMVATDFGDASRNVAHIAANLAHPGGTLILVHSAAHEWIVEEGDEGAALVQREGIEHAFKHLVQELTADKLIKVETLTRTGDPQTQLMAAAEQISPDIIAVASQRHHLLTRLLLGSVTRTLVREGKWSMLIVPPSRIHSTSLSTVIL